jgi:hypothetical protein
MPKICQLNSWEWQRLFEKGTQPVCSNHHHVGMERAIEMEAADLGFFTSEPRPRFVRDEERVWRVIGLNWQLVTIAKRGGGRRPASNHKTKFPQRAQGSNSIPRVIHAATAPVG